MRGLPTGSVQVRRKIKYTGWDKTAIVGSKGVEYSVMI